MELTGYQKRLIRDHIQDIEYKKMGCKTTVALLKHKNGFEIVGTSACVRQEDFKNEIGEFYSLIDGLKKLDELQGFELQQKNYKRKAVKI